MNYEETFLENSGGDLTITFKRSAGLNAFTFKMLAEIIRALVDEVAAGGRAFLKKRPARFTGR
jgi:enoyl-CoA hydratase/carnithine racemase